MSIFITGDCHSDFRKFNMDSFPEQKTMTRDDYMIICGDFGGVWNYQGEDSYEKNWLKWLENKSYTTLFVDGNHENFDRLKEYPEKKWHGGKVHEIRPHVLHMMRGEIFDINGYSFFAFGGARSHDISGGVFDPDDKYLREKIKQCERDEMPYRIRHRTWWDEEMPNEQEKQYGLQNLAERLNCVDFIVTHECPTSVLHKIAFATFRHDELNDYFQLIKDTVKYKKWFFGHFHNNQNVTKKDLLLYEQIIQIQ